MVIIRSSDYCGFLGVCLMQYKRNRVNWFYVLSKLDDPEMFSYFFRLVRKIRKGKTMSANRAAYNTLKHFYSTTTIAELCYKVGL